MNRESLSLTVEEGFEVLLIAIGSKSVDDTKWRDESLVVVPSPWHQHQAGKGRQVKEEKHIEVKRNSINVWAA